MKSSIYPKMPRIKARNLLAKVLLRNVDSIASALKVVGDMRLESVEGRRSGVEYGDAIRFLKLHAKIVGMRKKDRELSAPC